MKHSHSHDLSVRRASHTGRVRRILFAGKAQRSARARGLRRAGAITGAAALVGALLVPLQTAVPAVATTPVAQSWSSAGYHTWTVPAGVHTIEVTAVGGSGGNADGGRGARVSGTRTVTPGQTLSIWVASAGGWGEQGGGSGSWGARGYGYTTGGYGGTGSWPAQGGGGGGGSSAVSTSSGATPFVIAAGGGGGGGEAGCHGNPGGDAGSSGYKTSNSFPCFSDGGDPGVAGVEFSGHGRDGEDADSSSGQGGGGGGGAGYFGGGGADASSDGGGGGGGGLNRCVIDDCASSLASWGNGSVQIRAIHTPVLNFDSASYAAHTGNLLTLSGTVTTSTSAGGTPTGQVQLSAADGSGSSEVIATVPLVNGHFSYTCTAQCGIALADVTTVQGAYLSNNTAAWANSSGEAGLTLHDGITQTTLVIDPLTAVTGQEREFTAAVVVLTPAFGPVTGDVELRMSNVDGSDETVLGTTALQPNQQATWEVAVSVAESKRFWAVYLGAPGYVGSESPKQTLLTNPAETAVTGVTVPQPSVAGQEFELQLWVEAQAPGSGIPTGSVRIVETDLGIDTSVALDAAGEASLAIEGQSAGELSFQLEYLGDGNYHPSDTTVTHTVERAAVDLTLSVDPSSIQFGESFTLGSTAEAIAPGAGEVTGEIEFGFIDGEGAFATLGEPVALVNGAAELTLTGVDAAAFTAASYGPATYEFEARYAQTENFFAAVSPRAELTVSAAEAFVTVVPDPTVNTYSLSQVVRVSVTGAENDGVVLPAEGTVQLYRVLDDGSEQEFGDPLTLDEHGEAVAEFAWLELGGYEVFGLYSGSANHLEAASDLAEFSVEPARAAVNLTGASDAVIGEEHTFSIDVTAYAMLSDSGLSVFGSGADQLNRVDLDFAPTGTIDLLIDGAVVEADVELVEGTDGWVRAIATVTHVFDAAGVYEMTAVYGGDEYVRAGASEVLLVTASPALVSTGADGLNGLIVAGSLLLLAGATVLARGRSRQSGVRVTN